MLDFLIYYLLPKTIVGRGVEKFLRHVQNFYTFYLKFPF
jgi:hypothetical protein